MILSPQGFGGHLGFTLKLDLVMLSRHPDADKGPCFADFPVLLYLRFLMLGGEIARYQIKEADLFSASWVILYHYQTMFLRRCFYHKNTL